MEEGSAPGFRGQDRNLEMGWPGDPVPGTAVFRSEWTQLPALTPAKMEPLGT